VDALLAEVSVPPFQRNGLPNPEPSLRKQIDQESPFVRSLRHEAVDRYVSGRASTLSLTLGAGRR